MTDHAKFEEQICALLDGELSEAEETALRAHLDECAGCRAFMEAMKAVYGAAAKDLPEAPADLAQNVMERVRAESEPPKKAGRIVRFPYKPLAAAAAAALVIWAGARSLPMFRAKDAAVPAAGAVQMFSAAADTGAAEESVETAEEEAAVTEGTAFRAENKAAAMHDAAPAEYGEPAAAAPAEESACDELPPPAVTVRGTEILFDGKSVTLEELAERLTDAAGTGVELLCEEADTQTAEAVRDLLADMGIPIL